MKLYSAKGILESVMEKGISRKCDGSLNPSFLVHGHAQFEGFFFQFDYSTQNIYLARSHVIQSVNGALLAKQPVYRDSLS